MSSKEETISYVESSPGFFPSTEKTPVEELATGYKKTLGQKEGWQASVQDAYLANLDEHEITVRRAIRAYPWAVMWSLLVSMSINIEGYDTNLIGNFYSYA
jgi:hypothetical protein